MALANRRRPPLNRRPRIQGQRGAKGNRKNTGDSGGSGSNEDNSGKVSKKGGRIGSHKAPVSGGERKRKRTSWTTENKKTKDQGLAVKGHAKPQKVRKRFNKEIAEKNYEIGRGRGSLEGITCFAEIRKQFKTKKGGSGDSHKRRVLEALRIF